MNDDGIYETDQTTNKTLTHRFASAGMRLVRARVTDPAGAQTVSAPIALRILDAPALFIAQSANHIHVSWPTNATGFALESTAALVPSNWQSVTQQPIVLGNSTFVTFTNPPGNTYFRLKK